MAWFKMDDQLHGHPKARKAGLPAMGLWSLAGSYCMAYKLNGHVDRSYVASWPNGTRLAKQLVDAGLWHASGHSCKGCPQPGEKDGWVFHDWLDFQPDSNEIEKARSAARERQAKLRERRRTSDGKIAAVTDMSQQVSRVSNA